MNVVYHDIINILYTVILVEKSQDLAEAKPHLASSGVIWGKLSQLCEPRVLAAHGEEAGAAVEDYED